MNQRKKYSPNVQLDVWCCSLFFSRFRSEGWPHHGRTSPLISVLPYCPRIDVLYPGLPRPRAPGIVPCIISLFVSLWCDHSMLASLFWQCLTIHFLLHYTFVFFAIRKTRRIFVSPFISNASRRVFPLFPSVQISQPCVATGQTSAFISRIFVEIGMLWLFHIFCSDAPIACRLINLVRNFIFCYRDPSYGNVSICSSSSF